MGDRGRLDQFLSQVYEEDGATGIVDSLSFLLGAFVVTRKGVVIGANQAFLDIVDYDTAQVIGMAATELVPEPERSKLSTIFSENLTRPYQLSLVRRDGAIRRTRVSPKLFQVRQDTYRLAEFVDITDTLEAEDELRESERRFKAIFSQAAIGIARIDTSGHWLQVNRKLCEILGYSEPELRTLSYLDVCYAEDRHNDQPLLADLVAGVRSEYTLEKRYVHKNGNIVWCQLTVSLIRDEQGNPDYFVAFLDDICQQISLRERLTLSDEIVSASTDLLAIFDEHCHYRAVNDAYAEALDMDRNSLPGQSVVRILGREFYEGVLSPKLDILRKGDKVNYSLWFDFPKSGRRFMNVSYYPLFGPDQEFRGFTASARDITDLKMAEIEMRELNEKLERYSYVDGLTRITNRRMLDVNLSKEWNRAKRAGSTLSFIMIDIDFFKLYNDHYGHLQGDECLKRIAQILNGVASRSSDVLARFGGEEFAILVPDASLEQAVQLAEKCRAAVNRAGIPHEVTRVRGLDIISISTGVSSIVPDGSNHVHDLIDLADKRLYKAKKQGRNCTVYS